MYLIQILLDDKCISILALGFLQDLEKTSLFYHWYGQDILLTYYGSKLMFKADNFLVFRNNQTSKQAQQAYLTDYVTCFNKNIITNLNINLTNDRTWNGNTTA